MGIWSYPIGVYCEKGYHDVVSGKDVFVRFDDDTSPPILLSNHSTIVSIKEPVSFEESIMATCDCAKIYGYFDDRELEAWETYFDVLMAQNPELTLAEAHFFCTDHDLAYFARKKRGCLLEWLEVSVGNLVCYDIEWYKCNEEDECPSLVFRRGAYWNMCTQKRQVLDLLSKPEEVAMQFRIRKILAKQ